MVLRRSSFGPFYGCTGFPACRGSHGAHPDGRPLGTPGDSATKRARKAAHKAFDPLWRTRVFASRFDAYGWLAEQLGLTRSECHISKFDEAGCARVIELCSKKIGD